MKADPGIRGSVPRSDTALSRPGMYLSREQRTEDAISPAAASARAAHVAILSGVASVLCSDGAQRCLSVAGCWRELDAFVPSSDAAVGTT